MNCRTIALSAWLWLAIMLSSCLPFPYPGGEIDRDDMDSRFTGIFDYAVSRDAVIGLLDRSATREDVIATLGRPLRYRKQYVAYEVCWAKAGFAVIVGFPPYLLPYNVAGGGLGCNELVLEFDDQNRVKAVRETPRQRQFNEREEDMVLREYGHLGDPIAQRLWEHSTTYYMSQDAGIAGERAEKEKQREREKRELADDMRQRAEKGDPEAQFQLYLIQDRRPLKWLCRAADQGFIAAQMQLGYLYGSGAFGFEQDYARSYLWYRLAGSGNLRKSVEKAIKKVEKRHLGCAKGQSCYIAERIVELRGVLGREGVSRAEQLVREWAPGQCEQELVREEPQLLNN